MRREISETEIKMSCIQMYRTVSYPQGDDDLMTAEYLTDDSILKSREESKKKL